MQNEKKCVDIRNFTCNLILRINMYSGGTKMTQIQSKNLVETEI